jgi:hypothetical protein
MIEHITDTSKWSLVIHRVTETSVEVWVGTLFPTLTMPQRARVRLTSTDGPLRTRNLSKSDWKRPFRKTSQRFYSLVSFQRLDPGSRYKVEFDRFVEPNKDQAPGKWQHLRSGQFDTLPERLPRENQPPFTIGLGSCFYDHRDGGQAAGAYQALYERGPDNYRPAMTVLTGDQVYLDIGFDSLSLLSDEIRQRIADDYARHWQALGGILNRGATWMLPDDHEYWNDYPFYDSIIPQLLALKLDAVRKTWTRAASDAVKNVQRCARVESFSIGGDLSVCLADLRSFRSKRGFLPASDFQRLLEWARDLQTPGVIFTPQPVIIEENESERNLLSFKKQYSQLLEALASSGHDIVLLSGDVHFGRIASCALGNNGARLIEIISSPLSNLTYLNGIATSKPEFKPKRFPDSSVNIPGWSRTTVKYSKDFAVTTRKGHLFSAYPKDRTREHFMTIGFQRRTAGGIKLTAQAWRVRERAGTKNLPKKDFARAFQVVLN